MTQGTAAEPLTAIATTKKHYDAHLAPVYEWLFGGAEENYEANRRFFKAHHLLPKMAVPVAIDLGAGTGFQSVPLAEAGYQVFALDFSDSLLGTLSAASKERGLNIRPIHADLSDFTAYANKDPELIVCMGDTLTHLDSLRTVESLVYQCYDELLPGGNLAVSFRDYSEERQKEECFILLRSEPNRIATVCLDYSETHVTVSDLLYRNDGAQWSMQASSYRKLRIAPVQVLEFMEDAGFEVAFQGTRMGQHEMIGRKD